LREPAPALPCRLQVEAGPDDAGPAGRPMVLDALNRPEHGPGPFEGPLSTDGQPRCGHRRTALGSQGPPESSASKNQNGPRVQFGGGCGTARPAPGSADRVAWPVIFLSGIAMSTASSSRAGQPPRFAGPTARPTWAHVFGRARPAGTVRYSRVAGRRVFSWSPCAVQPRLPRREAGKRPKGEAAVPRPKASCCKVRLELGQACLSCSACGKAPDFPGPGGSDEGLSPPPELRPEYRAD